jgi:hypothetical protein
METKFTIIERLNQLNILMKINSSLLIVGFISASVLFSCKKPLDELSFSKDYASANFVADTTSFVGVRDLGSFTTNTEILSTLEADGFELSNLNNVVVNKITISNVNSSQNLNYFRSLQMKISNSLGTDNLAIAEIQLPEETTQTSVELVSKGIELKEIFKDGQIQFSLTSETDLPILPNPVPLNVTLSFSVKAALGD